jgi:hypothetical protein
MLDESLSSKKRRSVTSVKRGNRISKGIRFGPFRFRRLRVFDYANTRHRLFRETFPNLRYPFRLNFYKLRGKYMHTYNYLNEHTVKERRKDTWKESLFIRTLHFIDTLQDKRYAQGIDFLVPNSRQTVFHVCPRTTRRRLVALSFTLPRRNYTSRRERHQRRNVLVTHAGTYVRTISLTSDIRVWHWGCSRPTVLMVR